MAKSLHRAAVTAAERFMARRGYDILATEYRCKAGKCDFVCNKDDDLVFVKVQARSGGELPEEKVDNETRAKFERIALSFLSDEFTRTDVKVREDYISLAVIAPDRALIKHHVNVHG